MQTSYRSAALACSALVFLVMIPWLAPAPVDAACNAIPDWYMLSRTQPQQFSPNVPVFRYRGAVGSVDQPYVLPAADDATPDVVNLGPAKQCEPEATSTELEARIIFPHGAKPAVVTVAGTKRCAEIDAAAASTSSYRALGCATGATIKRRYADGYCWNELVMPNASGWASLQAKAGSDLVGDMRIVVVRAGDPIVAEAAVKPCAEIAKGFTGVACIDRLYVAKPGDEGIALADVDESVCNFNRPPENDFAKLCIKSSPNHGKKCQHRPGDDTMDLYVDDCGNVRMLFDYRKLLDPTADPKKYRKRSLGGASVLPAFAGDTGRPIRIPGREYLASTNENGQGFENKPRFEPILGPAANEPTELRLDGDADKGRSALALLPRRKASLVCENVSPEEACDGIDDNETEPSCKDDRGASAGKCMAPTDGPRYFVCDSGRYAGQPCTRSKHCWLPDGLDKTARCNATPKCWDPASNTLTTECTPKSVCAGALECGVPLFDLRPRRDQEKFVRLNRLPSGAERGVCDIGLTNNAQPPTCASNADCDSGVECVRYRLEAFDNVD